MKRIFAYMAMLLILCACTKHQQQASDNKTDVGISFPTDVPDLDGYTVKGQVYADSRPLAGVVISDGRNVTKTDKNGMYWLPSSYQEGDRIVWISIPSGYMVNTRNGWEPQFWHALDTEKLQSGTVQRHDFVLKSVNQGRFRLVAFSDTHIRGLRAAEGITEMDSVIFRSKFIPKLQAQSDASPVYAVCLGDMIQEYAIDVNGTGLPEYKKCLRDVQIPIFHIPGNHDYYGKQTKNYSSDTEGLEPKEYYRAHLGPTYYSMNIGNNHFLMLDGTIMLGSNGVSGGYNKYLSRISPRQLEWIASDLAAVEDKASTALIICCHQPFYMYHTGEGQGVGSMEKANRETVMDLLTGFSKVTILSGHQHYTDSYSFIRGGAKVTQYVHNAITGPFYRSKYCVDGSPCGLTDYDFIGTDFRRTMLSYYEDCDFQVKFYTKGVTTLAGGKSCLLMNVPAYAEGWSVHVTEYSVQVKNAERVFRTDPDYTAEYAANNNFASANTSTVNPVNNSHMFEYVPSNPNARIVLTVTGADGSIYRKQIN